MPTLPPRCRLVPLASVVLCLGIGLGSACSNKSGAGSVDPETARQKLEAEIDARKKDAAAGALIDLANDDLKMGRYVSALRRAEEALASNPEDANAHTVLGAARWRAGDFEGSTAAYRKAVAIDPKNFGAVLGLARNLQTAGQHAEAAKLQDVLLAEDKGQVDPRLAKLWSYYALGDADAAAKELDEIFQKLPADDPQLPLVQAFAAFVRPLVGKGPFFQIKGDTGSSDANLSLDLGVKYAGAEVGGEFAQVVFLEGREECVIDTDLAKTLKLTQLATLKPVDSDTEVGLVLIPSIKFGKLELTNVPALVQPLDGYAAIGEKPGMILGRQALGAFGSLSFDFPGHALTLTKAAPAAAPEGAADLPLLLLSLHVHNAPAIPISINGSEHRFYVYLGGLFRAGLAVAKKPYLKSGALPRVLAEPEDPEHGIKLAYIQKVNVGGNELPAVGAQVLLLTPPDTYLGMLLANTGFELGGYVNVPVMSTWKLTYAFGQGRVFVQGPGMEPAVKPAG